MTISNNLGDAKSIITHPATTTHQRLPDDQKVALGITPGMVRLSVGLEDATDLIAEAALAMQMGGSVQDVAATIHAHPTLAEITAFRMELLGYEVTTAESTDEASEQLAERLQARLGADAVAGLAGVEDHRPEYSWRSRKLDEPPNCTALAHRPAWLLPKPRRCDIRDYQFLAGPERIESGWWDGRDCRRDYFVVRDAQGSTLWAYH